MGSTWSGMKIASHPCTAYVNEHNNEVWRAATGAHGCSERFSQFENYFQSQIKYTNNRSLIIGTKSTHRAVRNEAVCTLEFRLVGGKIWGSMLLTKGKERKILPQIKLYMQIAQIRIVWVLRNNVLDLVISNEYLKISQQRSFTLHCFVNTDRNSNMHRAHGINTSNMSANEVKSLNNPCMDHPDFKVTISLDSILKLAELHKILFKSLGAEFGLPRDANRLEVHESHDAGFPVLYLPYESLVADLSLWLRVAKFLNLPQGDAATHFMDRTQKRVIRNHKEMIKNYDQLARDMNQHGIGEFLR